MPTTYLSEVKPWGNFSRHDRTPALAARSARWYDGQLGRWISPDSIIPDPANPQSLNRFSYALGNPLKYRDPSGHQACQADDHACWQRRWYQAHGYEWLDDSWVYTGNYFFADKIAFVETIVDITEGRHLPRQFTGFTLVDGPLTYSIVQRGEDNILSKAFGAIAFVADTVDFAITSGFGAAYTIEQVVTAAVGGPPGALAGLLAGDAGYKAVNLGLLFVDGFGLGMIAYADIPESDKARILGLNAVELLRRTAWFDELKLPAAGA